VGGGTRRSGKRQEEWKEAKKRKDGGHVYETSLHSLLLEEWKDGRMGTQSSISYLVK
jgi:hypothetical protein